MKRLIKKIVLKRLRYDDNIKISNEEKNVKVSK